MELLYGTYLTYRVCEALRDQQKGLSVKDIARRIHQYDSRREQLNLQKRIRASLRSLQAHGMVEREQDHTICNIIVYTYKLNTNEAESTRRPGQDGPTDRSAHAEG